MSVANYWEAPSITREQFQQVADGVRALLGGTGIAPEGILFHADGPTDDGGWWVFDLWESDEHSTRFNDTILAPAIAQASLPPTVYRRLEVSSDSTQVPPGGTD